MRHVCPFEPTREPRGVGPKVKQVLEKIEEAARVSVEKDRVSVEQPTSSNGILLGVEEPLGSAVRGTIGASMGRHALVHLLTHRGHALQGTTIGDFL